MGLRRSSVISFQPSRDTAATRHTYLRLHKARAGLEVSLGCLAIGASEMLAPSNSSWPIQLSVL